MIGYPDGTFKPEKGVTRAEVATVFCRISGKKNPVAANYAFKDVGDDNWAKGFIEHSTTVMKLFGGYPDGNFQPNRPITRAELAQVVSNYLSSGKPSPLTVYFNDDKDHWAKASIAEAKRNNIVSGYLDGTFKPDNSITRAELVTMVNNLLFRGPFINDVQTWPDVSPSYWAFGQVEEGSTDHIYTRNEKGEEVPVK